MEELHDTEATSKEEDVVVDMEVDVDDTDLHSEDSEAIGDLEKRTST